MIFIQICECKYIPVRDRDQGACYFEIIQEQVCQAV